MNILYIAYSCSPHHGSEDRIGWKIPEAASKRNRVFVITKEEHRQEIECYQQQNPSFGISFHYADIPGVYKRLFKGFAYSGRLNIWHKNALVLAEQICRQEKIDVIHQITPVEFRSIGDYGRIPRVKFVCGPLGGGEYIPNGLRHYARRHVLEELIRVGLNGISRCKLRRSGLLSRCHGVLFANEETRQYLSAIPWGNTVEMSMTEIGIDPEEIAAVQTNRRLEGPRRFLVAGRLIYRKGHELLLDALRKLPEELDYCCTILGAGPEQELLKKKCRKDGLDGRVVFKERVPFHEMNEIYQNTHVLIMPSLRETTGSVLLEAMSRGIPIVTIGRFGGAGIVNKSAGWLYQGSTRNSYIGALKKILAQCITDPEAVCARGTGAVQSCREYVWDKKIACYQDLYTQLVQNTED